MKPVKDILFRSIKRQLAFLCLLFSFPMATLADVVIDDSPLTKSSNLLIVGLASLTVLIVAMVIKNRRKGAAK